MSAGERGSERVGFVGLGMMGTPMAQRLAEAGYEVAVFDARRDVAARFASAHAATPASSLEELASSCDVVVTMLPNGAIVRDVVAGEGDSLRSGAREGFVVIDMSSSEPAGTQELGRVIACDGIELLDAPVSGGVEKAITGELAILVGGPEALTERWRGLLSTLGRHVFHTGPLGTGHAMKALNNLLSAAGLMATAEVLMVGTRFGLEPSLMLEVLNASTGRNNSTERKFGPFVLTGTYDSGFALDLMVKDLRIALGIARDTDTPAPLSDEVLELCAQAQAALGAGSDHTAVAKWVQDRVGTRYDGQRGDAG